MRKYKILGVILARSGSKSIKNKNITIINGKPLIAYTISSALKSKSFQNIVVSTDSKKIQKISKKFGAEAPFLRPKKISGDKAKAVDALHHALVFCEKKNKIRYDYIVELMCTNPLKNSADIKKVVNLQIKSKADSVIAVLKLNDHHPIRIKKIINNKIRNFCFNEVPETHRQELKPDAYIRCGSIYSMRRDMLLKKIRYGTKNSLAYVMPSKRVVNIDEKEDLEYAKFKMKKYSIKIEK